MAGGFTFKPGRAICPVSRRHDLEQHRHSLSEIREIMNAMKTLAYMETRKLTRFLDSQQAVVANIEATATDFLSFHDNLVKEAEPAVNVYLLIGTERGFCGDINQRLVSYLEIALNAQGMRAPSSALLILVGRKLHLLMEEDERVTAFIVGASVAEEVVTVLEQVARTLARLQDQHGALTLHGLYYGSDESIETTRLLPPFAGLHDEPPRYSHAPLLNLSTTEFLLELTDHYLFAALNEMFYTSLMAENHHRVIHLEGAVKHLDDESTALQRRSNALRQEEITEEIEVILLNTDSLISTGVGEKERD